MGFKFAGIIALYTSQCTAFAVCLSAHLSRLIFL